MSIAQNDHLSEFYRFVDAHPDLSQADIGRHFGIKQSAVSRRLTRRKRAGFTDGAPSRTALQVIKYVGSPEGAPGSPDIARQSDVDELKTRVEVLEAVMATLPQQPTYQHGSPNGFPTHKRGFVLADDLFDAIHTYAKAHHLQVKEVLDLALRRFFAQTGEEVHHT